MTHSVLTQECVSVQTVGLVIAMSEDRDICKLLQCLNIIFTCRVGSTVRDQPSCQTKDKELIIFCATTQQLADKWPNT